MYNKKNKMTITNKAVKGVFWVTASTIVARSLRFLTTLILAKLLLPSDFGLLAIGLLVINCIVLFRDLGLGHALVQRQLDIQEAADTAFMLNLVSAFIFLILINLFAPLLAKFFRNPAVEPIVRVLSLAIVIDALGIIPSFMLDKQLAFRKQFLPETISTFGYCLIAITLAFLKFGVWSIIYAQIISSIILAYTLWKVTNWKLSLIFNRKLASELFLYGKYIIGMNLLIFGITNIDNAFIGRFTDTKNLGFYTFAMTIANLPVINISYIIGRVTFPTYSHIQKDRELLYKTYFNTLKHASLLVVPISFGIFIFFPELLRIFYADKWLPAIPLLQILTFYGLFKALASISGNILMAVGAVKRLLLLEAFSLTVAILLLFPVTKNYGVFGISILMTLVMLFNNIVICIMVNKYIHASLRSYIKIILPYAIISVACTTTAYFIIKLISTQPNLLLICFAILLTAASYLLINFIFDKELKYFFLNLKQKFLSV